MSDSWHRYVSDRSAAVPANPTDRNRHEAAAPPGKTDRGYALRRTMHNLVGHHRYRKPCGSCFRIDPGWAGSVVLDGAQRSYRHGSQVCRGLPCGPIPTQRPQRQTQRRPSHLYFAWAWKTLETLSFLLCVPRCGCWPLRCRHLRSGGQHLRMFSRIFGALLFKSVTRNDSGQSGSDCKRCNGPGADSCCSSVGVSGRS